MVGEVDIVGIWCVGCCGVIVCLKSWVRNFSCFDSEELMCYLSFKIVVIKVKVIEVF